VRFGILWGSGLATGRTEAGLGRRGYLGLGLDGLLEDFASDDLADLNGEVLEIVERGAPGGAFRSPELVDGVFGGALEGETYLIEQRGDVQGLRHPKTLSGDVMERRIHFPPRFIAIPFRLANLVSRPLESVQ
jgi:hypothetical protein